MRAIQGKEKGDVMIEMGRNSPEWVKVFEEITIKIKDLEEKSILIKVLTNSE